MVNFITELDSDMVARILLAGNSVSVARSVYYDWSEQQKESAINHDMDSRNCLYKLYELQNAIRDRQEIEDGWRDDTFKVSSRYLNLSDEGGEDIDEIENNIVLKSAELDAWKENLYPVLFE